MKTFRIKENSYYTQKNDIYKLANWNDQFNRKLYNKIKLSIGILVENFDNLTELRYLDGLFLIFITDMRDNPDTRIDKFINNDINYFIELCKSIVKTMKRITDDYEEIEYEFYINIIQNMANILFAINL